MKMNRTVFRKFNIISETVGYEAAEVLIADVAEN